MECTFVEMKPFTRRVVSQGLDGDLRRLQDHLRQNPAAGALDPGACGLRKVRMGDAGRSRGKRSSFRVHYLHVPHRQTIYLFNLYSKDEQDALTPEQKKMLCALILRMTIR